MTRAAGPRRLDLASVVAALAAGLVALLAASASAAPAPGSSSDGCAVPKALLAAREKAEAKKLYVAILKSAPATECAVAGLKTINTPALTCEAADKTFEQGDLVGALAAYRRLGETTCATAGVTAVREVVRLCAEGNVDLRLEHELMHEPPIRALWRRVPMRPAQKPGSRNWTHSLTNWSHSRSRG